MGFPRRWKAKTLVYILSFLAVVAYLGWSFFDNDQDYRITMDHVHDEGDGSEFTEKNPISTSLMAEGDEFTLDGQPFRILSGSIHYFRVPPEYWRDRLVKLKAAGLNTVTLYVPWNVHEPQQGQFKFNGTVDVIRFVRIAHDLGLYVILRPGPYICSEWDWGGMPYWLLKDENMKVRSMYAGFTSAVQTYFSQLLPMIRDLQHSKGGPIIAVQIENEYGVYGRERRYIAWLRDLLRNKGIVEFMFVCEPLQGLKHNRIPGLFVALNFRDGVGHQLNTLKRSQPDRPIYISELWMAWFDHWGEQHHVWSHQRLDKTLSILLDRGASFNLYMFHGGTNFGFMNGANRPFTGFYPNKKQGYQPTVTSYDFDAPINEAGQTTDKYFVVQRLMSQYNPNYKNQVGETEARLANDARVPMVDPEGKIVYGNLKNQEGLTLTDALDRLKPIKVKSLKTMEYFGRGHGYIVYRTSAYDFGHFEMRVNVADRATVIVNNSTFKILQGTKEENKYHDFLVPTSMNFDKVIRGFVRRKIGMVNWVGLHLKNKMNDMIVLVENMGRVNAESYPGTLNNERKGMTGTVHFSGPSSTKLVTDWSVYTLDMNSDQLAAFRNSPRWDKLAQKEGETRMLHDYQLQPTFFRIKVPVSRLPPNRDYYVDMDEYIKGITIVNEVNLGRYWSSMGPTNALFCPASYLAKAKGKFHEVICKLRTL